MNIECPNCGLENAYFDTIDEIGTYYFCPDCDNSWCDDRHKIKPEDVDISNKVINKEPISKELISKIYSPRNHYIKMLEVCREDMEEEYGVEEYFGDDISTILLQTPDYLKIKSVNIPKEISKEKSEEIINRNIKLFLESVDELSAFPTIPEWANYINAPEELISQIFQDFNPLSSIIFMLPSTDDNTLIELFEGRLVEFQSYLLNQNEITPTPNFNQLKSYFYAVINNDYYYLSYEEEMVVDELRKFLKKELRVISNYKKAIRNIKSESFAGLITKCKENNMNKRDAIVYILDNYFHELYDEK
ncbi:MAG: hypothetical protein H6573_31455 [Lewinellaceae bacterium]|nr:hypothetical protein [Bacteroidota bacterium]MCB9351974.1 hypothetical protein [Lewinellaceae bacterium]